MSGARAQVLIAAVLFSTGGAAIKGTALTAWQVAGFRSGLAALILAACLRGAWPRWRLRTLLVASAYAATLVLFVLANKLTTAANSIFLQSTAPLYIALLAPWLLDERARRRDLAFMAAIGAGLATCFLGSPLTFATAPNPTLGNLLGAGSGVTWALTIIGLRGLAGGASGDPDATRQAVVAGNLVAFVVCLPFAFPIEAILGARDWLVVAYLGTLQLALAYLFLLAGLRHVPALDASLLLLLEPTLNPVWAWLAHGEAPGAWPLLGGGVIILATALKAWGDSRDRALAGLQPPV